MKRVIAVVSLLLLAVQASATVDHVDDFALIDHEGRFHQLSRYADRDAIVLFVQKNGCTVSRNVSAILEDIRSKFAAAHFDAEFLMLNVGAGDSRSAIKAEAAQYGIRFPILIDQSQVVADALDVQYTGEVVVIDPRRMEVFYRGPIDDRSREDFENRTRSGQYNYLEDALSALFHQTSYKADVPPPQGRAVVPGLIPRSAAISYAEDVAPVLEKRCVSCHQAGGAAPWSMSSHEMVKGWSPMIRETVMTMRMPPGQIDAVHQDRFVGVHHITPEEKSTLVEWIDRGAVNEGDRDPLAERPAQGTSWALGEPDLIVDFPVQEIPADGVLDYKFVPVEIGLAEDRWVRAYEFDIGDKEVLHHVVAYTQDEKQQRQNSSRGGSRSNFGGYAPGREHVVFNEGTGVLLQEEMRFMLQIHYTTVGRPATDASRLGLYFRDSAPARPLTRTAVMNGEFVIPAGASDHTVTAEITVRDDSYLYNFAPHMHYRGKRIRYEAVYPDGTTEELLSIPNFQHNFQMMYRLREPKFLPAGTRILSEGAFDNSALNPLNPDPTQEVVWGDQVWDEMFIGWLGLGKL